MMKDIVEVIKGDITLQHVDAIVNAANNSLLGGGGVDGAIHRSAGPSLLAECKEIRNRQGGCATGQAVITNGGKLPAKKVIHTVGPVWHGGRNNEEKLLADCYTNSLSLAVENGLKTIAFPNISTGVYGFPKERAATIAVNAVRTFIDKHPGKLSAIIFVCFDEENFSLYRKLVSN